MPPPDDEFDDDGDTICEPTPLAPPNLPDEFGGEAGTA